MSTVYLDACAAQRPLDPTTSERVRVEAASVVAILQAAQARRVSLCWSPALDDEMIEKLVLERRLRTKWRWAVGVRTLARVHVAWSPEIERRARELHEGLKFGAMDALHLACAETVGATFVSTDDRLVRKATRIDARLRVKVVGPAEAVRLLRLDD